MSQRQIPRPSRRRFLQGFGSAVTAAALAGATGRTLPAAAAPKRRPKVAVIFTTFYLRSHAHVILENFVEPYYFNGKRTDAGCDVVSFFPDQIPQHDMARKTAKTYGIPIYNSIEEALCLGGKELAVDAVLSIAEHGQYPSTKIGQRMYPHKRFFDESVAVMKRSGRFVPFFNLVPSSREGGHPGNDHGSLFPHTHLSGDQ